MFTSQPHQRASRRSRSLSPVRSTRHVVPRRNRSLGRKPVPVGAKRSYDEAFIDDDDDWIFHPALDPNMETSPSSGVSSDGHSSPPGGVMAGGGPPPPPPPQPLLDFEMHPVGPRRNWRDVLHKQRYQARIQQHREANPLTTWDERLRKRYDEPSTVRLKPTAASNPITRCISLCNQTHSPMHFNQRCVP